MVNLEDILFTGVGAVGSIFATTYEVSLAEDQSGVDFEDARPAAGTPFFEFSKWFFPIEIGKLTGLYFVQDYIDQPSVEMLIHGLMFGNVGMDIIYWASPGTYRSIVNTFSGLIGGTEEAAV